jgi:hypothetical protein
VSFTLFFFAKSSILRLISCTLASNSSLGDDVVLAWASSSRRMARACVVVEAEREEAGVGTSCPCGPQ